VQNLKFSTSVEANYALPQNQEVQTLTVKKKFYTDNPFDIGGFTARERTVTYISKMHTKQFSGYSLVAKPYYEASEKQGYRQVSYSILIPEQYFSVPNTGYSNSNSSVTITPLAGKTTTSLSMLPYVSGKVMQETILRGMQEELFLAY
jgi:hypothetical protein